MDGGIGEIGRFLESRFGKAKVRAGSLEDKWPREIVGCCLRARLFLLRLISLEYRECCCHDIAGSIDIKTRFGDARRRKSKSYWPTP